jgi:hypothetical protein
VHFACHLGNIKLFLTYSKYCIRKLQWLQLYEAVQQVCCFAGMLVIAGLLVRPLQTFKKEKAKHHWFNTLHDV